MTRFQFFPIYCRDKNRGLWPYPGTCYIKLPYRAVALSLPWATTQQISQLARHTCLRSVLVNAQQLLQTLGLGLFHPTTNKTCSVLVTLVWSLEKKRNFAQFLLAQIWLPFSWAILLQWASISSTSCRALSTLYCVALQEFGIRRR